MPVTAPFALGTGQRAGVLQLPPQGDGVSLRKCRPYFSGGRLGFWPGLSAHRQNRDRTIALGRRGVDLVSVGVGELERPACRGKDD